MSSPNRNNPLHNAMIDSKLFGVPLSTLCALEGTKIPNQIDQLITKIEMLGLYAEGIYRKSGVSSKIKELKTKMSEVSSSTEIDYESYNVHVLANVLKSFLREMPEPLLICDRYDDFLRAADLSETNDRVQTLLSLVKKIPIAHHSLLERLIFHLALVAQREQYNRMSASSLAIVFAPCVLRTNRLIPAQDSLNDIGRQTRCMETLITQKMLNVKSTLADIDTLDTAAHTATTRLSTLRSSKVFTPEELQPPSTNNMESKDTEEMFLEGHIQEIRKEKALLTSTLPSLARASSDDDLLSTDLDGEGGSLDDLSSGRERQDSHSIAETSREFKDSVDSALSSLGDNLSRIDVEPIAVSYNLRDQNIYYKESGRCSQTSLDREGFLKTNYTAPKSIGTTSKWTGSQQNLSHSVISGPSGCELQRQKPIVMRSISTGYEMAGGSSSSVQSGPGTQGNLNSTVIVKSNLKESKNNNRKQKRQSSLDDEPIMV